VFRVQRSRLPEHSQRVVRVTSLQRLEWWAEGCNARLLIASSARESECQRQQGEPDEARDKQDPAAEATATHVRGTEDRGAEDLDEGSPHVRLSV
jgi:hypothetical protein